MSIFKKVGKFFKKVAKVAVPVLKFGIGFVPGVGSLAAKAIQLGSVKKAMTIARGVKAAGRAMRPSIAPASPGAALVAVKHARHPHKAAVAGARQRGFRTSSGTKRRRKRSTTRTKRRSGARRLKFGSPAWRKKYLTGRKRRRG